MYDVYTVGFFDLLQPMLGTYFSKWLQMLLACAIGIALTFLWKMAIGGIKLLWSSL